jgi:long-chain acyl-CoA synthetase
MIKLPLFLLATEQNGILWILCSTNRHVPIYPTITEDDYEYILNHSGAIFVLYLMQKYLKSNKDKVPNLKEVFSLTLLKVVKLKELLLLGGPKQSK